MAKQAKLKPVEIKEIRKWRVNIPADISSTGKREQKRFDTKGEAFAFCEKLRARKDNFGGSLTSLSPTRMAEAAEAFRLLSDEGIEEGVLVAVREYIQQHRQRNKSVSLESLFEEFLGSKRDLHPKYKSEFKDTLDAFDAFRSVKVSDITTEQVKTVVSEETDSVRNRMIKNLITTFNFALAHEYIIKSPVNNTLKIEGKKNHAREIIPVDRAQTILNHALANSPEIVPYLALTLFTGVRPEDEALSLEWRDIEEGVLVVRETKVGDRRTIPLSANCKAWLDAAKARYDANSDKIMAIPVGTWQDARRAAYKAAGYTAIPQDAARHSFASYFLPCNNEDFGGLLSRMGHATLTTLRRHYLRHAPKAEAEKYWQIMPKS